MNTLNPSQLQGLHLFYHPMSNCAGRVLLAIPEKGLDVEKHRVNLLRSEQLTDAYLRINPRGEVPAIVHNGVALHESVEILRYLERQFPQTALTPSEPEQQAEMERWLDAATLSHEAGVLNYVYAAGLGRLPTSRDLAFYRQHIPHRARFHNARLAGKAANSVEQARAVLDQQFAALEATLAKSCWLAGDSYSLADIAWFPNTLTLRLLGYRFEAFPNLQRWMKAIEARPAFKQHYRSELPALPFWLSGPLVRLAMRLLRRTGNRA